MAPGLVDPAFQSIDSTPTTSVKQTAKPVNAHNYIPGRTTVTKHDDTYEFEHLRPRFPDITWRALTETPYSDKGLLGDVNFKHLLASATEVFDYNPKIGTEIHGVDLANLTDLQKNDLASTPPPLCHVKKVLRMSTLYTLARARLIYGLCSRLLSFGTQM
jgi:sulfonate dioxygenase